jgi:hypothetical protein
MSAMEKKVQLTKPLSAVRGEAKTRSHSSFLGEVGGAS